MFFVFCGWHLFWGFGFFGTFFAFFDDACQIVLRSWQEVTQIRDPEELLAYSRRLLKEISQGLIGDRPRRTEPRVVKKRKDPYRLMMQPRHELRERLKTGDNAFEN